MFDGVIDRNLYVNKVIPFIDKDLIKVFIGQRRVGKSYLLKQIANYLSSKKKITKRQIIFIDKEKSEFDFINNYKDLINYVTKSQKNKKLYVFIDEVQEIDKFEKALRELNSREEVDIYCTGSNANILSTELSTLLSGRYIEIKVNPLTYIEFLQFNELKDNDDNLQKYLKYGGLPFLKNLTLNDEIAYEYLKSIYSTIVLKDIVKRHSLRNTEFLERLILFIADNIGQITSAKSISDFLKSQRLSISPSVVLNYLSYLSDVYFINKVKRKDIVGKRVFEISEKYFFNDLGLRHAILGYNTNDIAKILENTVFNKLVAEGFKVNVGEINGCEIDFVAEKKEKILYIQVCYFLSNKQTVDREFGNLLKINDNYRKIVVSMDKIFSGNYKGVDHLYLRTFLNSDL